MVRPLFEYELVTSPAAGPIGLDEAKAACRIEHDDEDGFIQDCIDAAVALLDGPFGMLGRAIVTQSWTLRCAAKGVAGRIELPLCPVTQVTAIKTHDGETLNTQTVAEWDVQLARFSTLLYPPNGAWPAMDATRVDALQVTVSAGGDPALAAGAIGCVPASIKQAVKLLVAHWHANRGLVTVGSITQEIEFGLLALLANERR